MSNENPYEAYDPGGVSPQELLARLMALQSRIAKTISKVERNESEFRERQTKIVQDIDKIRLEALDNSKTAEGEYKKIASLEVRANGIDATVASLQTTVAGTQQDISSLQVRANSIEASVSSVRTDLNGTKSDVSSLRITADSISSRVSTLDSRMGSAESSITQNATQIMSKVSQSDYNGNEIVSMINQTPSYITIAAEKVNISGIVTIYDLQSAGATRIHGANILAGTLTADAITGGVLRLSNGTSIYGEYYGGYGSLILSAGNYYFEGGRVDFGNMPLESVSAVKYDSGTYIKFQPGRVDIYAGGRLVQTFS